MRRRIALLALIAIFVLPLASPVSAIEPAPVDPSPSATPTPEPTEQPSADPTDEPAQTEEQEPTDQPGVEPTATPAGPGRGRGNRPTHDETGRPDPTGRFIVLLTSGSDTAAVVERHGRREGIRADREFKGSIRGYSASLDARQRLDLLADPSVAAVVPDELIELTAQVMPTGVARIGADESSVAAINGLDGRVDADVAIVDTGIQPDHPDLNVVGGYNCSSSNPDAWRDKHGHGTHVAGTVAALDNTYGVVGVAPGARLWAVKILNDSGEGLLSWYVCGLDWILSQKDPQNPTLPLFESVNMSVAKDGSDDGNCGKSNNDALHRAICRLHEAGIPVVAAAANDSRNAKTRVPAAYPEVITVSALADTDGQPGGYGSPRCYSWGSYDKDDTFANFSNYGKVVDIIAPGKCIWSTKPGTTYGYMSGTSMAAPAVAGAVALYKASRPRATPAEVLEALQYLGSTDWDMSTDPDRYHEKLLDVSRIGPLGSFTIHSPSPAKLGEVGGSSIVPVTLTRSSTFFERVRLSLSGVPSGWKASLDNSTMLGWTTTQTNLRLTVPRATPAGRYEITIVGTNQGRVVTDVVVVTVVGDDPTAYAPIARPAVGKVVSTSSVVFTVYWPEATDRSTSIAGYQLQTSRNDGVWGDTISTSGTKRKVGVTLLTGDTYRFRVRARDDADNWSDWVEAAASSNPKIVNERSRAVDYSGSWAKVRSSSAIRGNLRTTSRDGASATLTFTGSGIGIVAPRSRSRGWFDVYLDDHFVKRVSLKRKALQHRRSVFAYGWTASGEHTIRVVFDRTSARWLGSLDAFVVVR